MIRFLYHVAKAKPLQHHYNISIFVLYCALLCKRCSLDISNFLEEISSLSHSVVSLYFFALITEEGFLISSCYKETNLYCLSHIICGTS